MRSFLITLTLLLAVFILKGQNLPVGFISYFETDFSELQLHKDFLLSPAAQFKINKGILTVSEKPDSVYSFLPPASIIINNNKFGDFIAEMRINQSGAIADSIGGVYLITGLRDSLNYYFVRLNEFGASFNRIYKGKQSVISHDSAFKIPANTWITLRIERDILTRTFTIATGTQKLICTDANLVMGFYGFGVKNKNLQIDKILIWAPTSIANPAPIFQ